MTCQPSLSYAAVVKTGGIRENVSSILHVQSIIAASAVADLYLHLLFSPVATFCLLLLACPPAPSVLICSTYPTTQTTTSPTSAMTVAQAVLHTLILTPPYGHLGNPNNHSTGQGNQPRGYVNTGVLACQNCKAKRKPDVHVQRTTEALLSKDVREVEMDAAVGHRAGQINATLKAYHM